MPDGAKVTPRSRWLRTERKDHHWQQEHHRCRGHAAPICRSQYRIQKRRHRRGITDLSSCTTQTRSGRDQHEHRRGQIRQRLGSTIFQIASIREKPSAAASLILARISSKKPFIIHTTNGRPVVIYSSVMPR